MSTKTTFKRVALVTVAALGFGMLSVVPSGAADNMELATSIAVGTVPTHRAGVTSNTPIVINLPSTAASGDTIVVGVSLLSCPATSVYCAVGVNPTNNTAFTPTANTTSRLDIVKASSGSGSYGSIFTDSAFSQSGTLTATQQYSIGADDSAGQVTLRIKFTPDVSGTYTFLVSTPNAVADVTALPTTGVTSSYYDASTVDTSAAFGVTTGATATAITLSAVTAAPAHCRLVYQDRSLRSQWLVELH